MDYYGNNDRRDYLAHYGVKGMKWRHHKYVTDDGRGTVNQYSLSGRSGKPLVTLGRSNIRYGRNKSESSRYLIVGGKKVLSYDRENKPNFRTKRAIKGPKDFTIASVSKVSVPKQKAYKKSARSYERSRRRNRIRNKVSGIISRLSRK